MNGVALFSGLLPGKVVIAPAIDVAAVAMLILVPLKALGDVHGASEPRLR